MCAVGMGRFTRRVHRSGETGAGQLGHEYGGVPSAGAGAVPGQRGALGVEDVDVEFAQELQRGMADLLGELESSVGTALHGEKK